MIRKCARQEPTAIYHVVVNAFLLVIFCYNGSHFMLIRDDGIVCYVSICLEAYSDFFLWLSGRVRADNGKVIAIVDETRKRQIIANRPKEEWMLASLQKISGESCF